MAIKFTPQGGLIYLTMVAFIAAAILLLSRDKRWKQLGGGFWFAGFVVAVASVVWRGYHTGHPPMQNLFEFFLCMAAALWPLSLLSKKQTGLDTSFQDALLGLLILFPAGFIFSEAPRSLPPALDSPLFIPHVGSYVAAYILLARAAFMALPMLWVKPTPLGGQECGHPCPPVSTTLADKDVRTPFPPPDRIRQLDTASRQTTALGFVLLTFGLLLGSLWGKICWGHYWQWDPKEMWSLATWFVYGAYFHYRLKNGVRHPRVLVVLLLLGLLFVLLTLIWVNISPKFPGVHNYTK